MSENGIEESEIILTNGKIEQFLLRTEKDFQITLKSKYESGTITFEREELVRGT